VAVERGGDGGRGVDDQEIAGAEVMRQVAEPGVGETVPRRDEQPHAVAGQSTLFGG